MIGDASAGVMCSGRIGALEGGRGHGELVVFEESGHSLQLEEAAKFEDVLAAFVRGTG